MSGKLVKNGGTVRTLIIICLFFLLSASYAFGEEKIVKIGDGYQKVKVKTICIEGRWFLLAVGNKKGVGITQMVAGEGSAVPCRNTFVN